MRAINNRLSTYRHTDSAQDRFLDLDHSGPCEHPAQGIRGKAVAAKRRDLLALCHGGPPQSAIACVQTHVRGCLAKDARKRHGENVGRQTIAAIGRNDQRGAALPSAFIRDFHPVDMTAPGVLFPWGQPLHPRPTASSPRPAQVSSSRRSAAVCSL